MGRSKGLYGCILPWSKNVEKDLSEHIQPGKSFDSIDDEETFKWLEAGRVEVVISESREGNRLISSDGRFSNIF